MNHETVTGIGDYAGGRGSPLLKGYSYSLQEIHAARDAGQLLCLRMETNYNCNLDCLYCYSYLRQNEGIPQMSLKDACDIVDQGVDLGLKSIVYLGGGEPTLYKDFWPLVEYINKRNITTVVFTNGVLMDSNKAKRLFDLGVSMMVKADGTEQNQNLLSGPGTYKRIHSGFETLLEVGFADPDGLYTRLGISPCATKVNILDIPEMWRFARRNNIFPNIERATEIGRATTNITLDRGEVRWLTQTLKDIDEKEFGLHWSTPFSAIPAHSCGIFLAGAAVKVDRGIALCPEMPSVANLADKSLAEIIKESPFSEARSLEENIEEPCASCEFLELCLGGCRSKALVYNGSIFAVDPFCPLLMGDQKIATEVTGSENQVPSFPLEHIEKELAGELLLATEESPLSCISVHVDIDDKFKSKGIERVLTGHLRDGDRIFRSEEDNSAYLLTFRDCNSRASRKIYRRLKSLLRSVGADMGIQLNLSTVSGDFDTHTSEQVLSSLKFGNTRED